MLIERDCATRAVYISQEAFINLVLTRFNLVDTATLLTPLASGTHLVTYRVIVGSAKSGHAMRQARGIEQDRRFQGKEPRSAGVCHSSICVIYT